METAHYSRRHSSTNRGKSYNPDLQRHGEVFRYKHSGSSGSSSWVLWGPNTFKKSQKSKPSQKCCGVLLASVIFLVLLLVITIAALAIYMGALRIDSQHFELIFDSSFRVVAGDSYDPSLEDSRSSLYKEKFKRYKSMIEKLYNASVLSPAIKYCSVMGFKSGSLIVFYRIILDRRKIPRTLSNVEEVVKSILVDEISSRKALAFKNIKVDEEDIHIKRYFGVSLSSLLDKEDNTTSGAQSEDVSSSVNTDDNTVMPQSHSSSPEASQPNSSLNSKRKYSTSHIQPIVTQNSFEPSELETEAINFDTHSTTLPPHKSVNGSFTIFHKPHFGDVFAAVKKPMSNQKNPVTATTVLPHKRTSTINKYSDLIETANDHVINESEIDDELIQSTLEALAHNSLLETNKHELKESTKEKIPDSAIKSEMSKSTEKLSGVGEAHVVVLPAVSSNQELLLSPYGTLHSKSTTNRPHSSKNKQSNQQNVPPEIVVTTEARKATPSYSHRNGPNQKSNDVQKQIVVLKEKSSSVNPNQQSKRRKNTDLRTSNKNGNLLYSSNITVQRDTEEYDSELKSISSFLKSEFPVLQKIGNLEEVLRAYKMNRTLGDSNKKYNLAPHESAIKRGDMAGMESSHEYQYAAEAPQRTPGHHHSPVVTLLPVRSNVGPGKPLRPRPHLGTINNIHTTTVISSPISKNDDFDYLDDQENISHKSSISIPNQQKFSQSYPKLEFSSIHSRYNNDSSKDKHVGFLEFLGRFNSESITKKSPLADKVSQTNILKGQNLDYGSLNIRNFLLPNPSNISKHFKDDFSEGLLHRTYLEGSSSFKEDIFPGHNEDDYLATTEESQKVILNTEVVTSTSVKVSYGEGTASYTEETTTRNILKRPKRTEIFNEPKISNTPLLKETEEKIFHSNERPPLIQRRDRTPKMAQDFLLHSNIHKMKFDRSKKKQNVDDDGFNDRTDHGRAPFVVYATSLENNDNLFSYGSEQHKEVLKERDGHLKASAPNKSESTGAGVDDVEKVVLVMSTSNNVSLVNENKTVEDTKDENKVITQSLLSQMVDKLNRVITNESSVSSLKYLIDQISKQHLKQSHHHESETNISTKAIPSSFNFNQVNGIPILTKVYTKLSKSNSTNKERNQTEFHLNINRSECDMNSSFRCGNGECVSIGSRCNQLVDCADGSDENNCSCADFLKSQFLTRKICDGIIDCWDFSDEHECEWCSPGQYICPNSRVCIERTRLCDGIKDCPLGDDEKQCINLFPMETRFSGSSYPRGNMQRRSDRIPGVLYERTDSYPKHVLQDGADSYLQNTLYPVYHDTGLLMIQKQGQWGKLCMNQINNFVMKSLKWKIADLGKVICKSMTFRDLNEIESVADNSNDDSVYYELSTNAINSSAAFKMSLLFEKTKCSQKQVVAVNCSSLECGIRPQANNIWGRIVGGANARLGAWPWQAALYKEGEFQCGATLISDQWLLSAGHCFYRAQEDYWVARLGTLRRGTKLPSPYEQLRPISRIILHPQYVDAGFINDISVLKMKSPVQFSSYVRPICLPHPASSFSDGTLCTVVGWGQLFEIGRVFPDTLQEVQLPIISTAECRKRTLFLPLYRVTENMFCAGFERGGRDACLGDSGGPLMCQEPDGRWSLLGVTSNGYGCARANRPGVYTKVANYIPWLHAAMAAAEYNETAWRQHACSGHRCPLGECLSKARVCNGYMECSDGSDEQGCR